MAIRKRENNVSDKRVDVQKTSTLVNKSEIKSESEPERIMRTFKEEAIHTLNVLESSGIDIYDTSRTPGMYVKQRLKRYYNSETTDTPKTLVNALTGGNNINKKKETDDSNISDDLRQKLLKAIRR